MKKLFVLSLLILQSIVLLPQELIISPDGKKRVLIKSLTNEKYQVVVNSNYHKEYEKIIKKKISFFTDSCKVMYIAKCNDGYCIVIDGIEQTHYSQIDELSFSPDNSHYAYMAEKLMEGEYYQPTEYLYIIDGVEYPRGYSFKKIIFSPDSKHWAYEAINLSGSFYVIDGEEQPPYGNLSKKGVIFSSDSKNWAYAALKNNEWICVSNGKESPHDDYNLCSSYRLPKVIEGKNRKFVEIGLLSSKSDRPEF